MIKGEYTMNNEVIATIAGETITQADFDAYVENFPQEQKAHLANPQAKQHFIDQMITMRLFAKLGEDEKLSESEEYKRIMAEAQREILAQIAVRETIKDATVTEEEMKSYYDSNKEQFTKGATVQAKHILVDSEEQCETIKKEIESGAKSFEDAAKEYSTCPSNARGGDLGEFSKGQMVKEFEDVAFEAEVGSISSPVKTQFGYHLVKVENRSDASVIPFEEVKEKIENQLIQQKRNELYQAKIAELKAKYMKEA